MNIDEIKLTYDEDIKIFCFKSKFIYSIIKSEKSSSLYKKTFVYDIENNRIVSTLFDNYDK